MRPTITHIALHVADVEACIAFYAQVCGLGIVHERTASSGEGRVVWMAAKGQERSFVIVLLPGGPGAKRAEGDFSHIGFAAARAEEVDRMAEVGRDRGRPRPSGPPPPRARRRSRCARSRPRPAWRRGRPAAARSRTTAPAPSPPSRRPGPRPNWPCVHARFQARTPVHRRRCRLRRRRRGARCG